MKLLLKLSMVGSVSPLHSAAFIDSDGAHGVTRRTGKRAGFTMVEIALCLAIIGFALVAIIGVLPAGLNVQRDNREETIIVHDANYLVDAIRNGQRGLDDLTNYVEAITNYVTDFDANGNQIGNTGTNGYTFTDHTVDNVPQSASLVELHRITNGYRIIGLLSTPKYLFNGRPFRPENDPVGLAFRSNYVIAYIRALSGSAVEKPPQRNLDVRDISFRYRLISEMLPYSNWNTNDVDFVNALVLGLTPEETNVRSNRWRVERINQANSGELRLNFRWPISPSRQIGPQGQPFRTMTAGSFVQDPGNPGDPAAGRQFWFVQPTVYLNPP
jgi:type II secretory pathway pseudopilin PulG